MEPHETPDRDSSALTPQPAEVPAAAIGATYEVFDHPDGELDDRLEYRREVIRLLRAFRPDAIITHRCNYRKPLIATSNMPDPEAGSVTKRNPATNQPEYRETLSDRVGPRARSRLFEMCRVIKMPLVEDYRLRSGMRS